VERLLEIVNKRQLINGRFMEESDPSFQTERVDGVPNARLEERGPEVEKNGHWVGHRLNPRLDLPGPRDESNFGPESIDNLRELGPRVTVVRSSQPSSP
jgi:hypothetical protein